MEKFIKPSPVLSRQELGFFIQEVKLSILEAEVVKTYLPEVFEKSGYQGYKIFIDRYTLKKKKGDVSVGDFSIVVTEKHPKFPKKELGHIVEVDSKGAIVELIEGGRIYQEFGLIDIPIEIHPDQVRRRVAKSLASVEDESIRAEIEEDFFEILINYFIPGGRILAGAGADGLTLINCFVIDNPEDSRKGILNSVIDMAEAHARGGGVGVNGSSMRPRYSHVEGVNGISSGSVSWGELYSVETGLIEQGGSRRGATMFMLHDWHPDIVEFINAKKEAGRFENVNMSVCISDHFMEKLFSGESWDLMFPDTTVPEYKTEWDGDIWGWIEKGYKYNIYDTVNPQDIWDVIVHAAWESAEPGLHYLERSNKMSNTWYFAPLIATNPCGEQPLPAYGSCNLGAVDLSRVVQRADDGSYFINYHKLTKTIFKAVRFLDNIIDLNEYHDERIEAQHKSDRRIGLGTMGLGELLIKMKIRYGKDAVEFIDGLYKFVSTQAYLASVELAKEKNPFPMFDSELFLQSGYMQNMPQAVRDAVREHGIRNAVILTQAPNGTTGTMMGTTTGVEPFYAWKLTRASRLGVHEETAAVLVELGYQDSDDLPEYCVTAMDMSPEDHLYVQATVQKWIDSAISKTTNVPAEWTVEQVDHLYRQAWLMGCKGVTIYRDGSRHEQVLTVVKNQQTQDNNCEACGEILVRADGCISCPNGCFSACSL